MESWSFLTNHARVLLCIAHDPGARLRDIAASLGITDRSVHAIVTDLTAAGYVVRHNDGAATSTRSRRTSRCPSPPARNPPSAKSWPCSWATAPGSSPAGPGPPEAIAASGAARHLRARAWPSPSQII